MALLVGAILVLPMAAYAATAPAAGEAELGLLITLLTGNIGKFFGLLVVFLGLWTAIAKDDTKFGIVIIALGVVITVLPAFYRGVMWVACPLANQLGSTCNDTPISGDTPKARALSEKFTVTK